MIVKVIDEMLLGGGDILFYFLDYNVWRSMSKWL